MFAVFVKLFYLSGRLKTKAFHFFLQTETQETESELDIPVCVCVCVSVCVRVKTPVYLQTLLLIRF